jgi:cellobiose-specific phosphotransferase system component IIB
LEYEAVDHQGIFAGTSVSDYWGSFESKCTDDGEQYASDVSSIVNNDVQVWESSPEVEDLEKLQNDGPRSISIMGPQVSMMSPQVSMMGPQVSIMGPQVSMMGPQVSMMSPQVSMMSPQVSMMSPSCAPCYSSLRHMAPCPLPPPFAASSAETLGRDPMTPLDVYFDLQ